MTLAFDIRKLLIGSVLKKIALFSMLLIAGLVGAQFLPVLFGDMQESISQWVTFFTMVGLSFIMIHVGYEFELNKNDMRSYGWDYVVAMTTAALPWMCAAAYFVFLMMPRELWSSGQAWQEVLIAGRFAAPTATGILFAMLAAAGLSNTWMFQKTRILAIFDDLDTVLLMVPLKIMIVGLAWQLGVVIVVMVVLLWIAWRWLHKVSIPMSWPWVFLYAFLISGISEAIYWGTAIIDHRIPIHLEVLLPAFVLGCIMKQPPGADPHSDDAREGHQEGPESPTEQRVSTIVSAVFMMLVGLSMPAIFGDTAASANSSASGVETTTTAAMASIDPTTLFLHVIVLTLIINVGKMFPAFCYRQQAHWRERLAVAIAMCPRGEVGAGVILLSLDYGIGGPIVSVAVLCLALNLVLTPLFVYVVNFLIRTTPAVHKP